MPDDTIGDLARQDLYPDERYMQPPQNAVGGLTPEDWMMSGQQPPAATYDYVPPQSWLQKAGDLARRDVANYQTGGVPAMMGQLAEDSSGEQDLAGGFGGNIKGVGGKIGAIADLAPHAPPFYSAVEQAVQGAKQTTAPGQQWAGFLRNQPGVKPEELNTLKLGDLFDQTGAVTKQDLLDHIAANKVQLGEVVKGDGPKFEFGTPDEQSAASQRFQTARQAINNMPANEIGTHEWNVASAELGAAEAAMRDVVPGWGRAPDSTVSPTKFSQYTLPGGENYRETLLTLPTKGEVSNDVFGRPVVYQAPGEQVFKSSHFDEPNILAHIRTNDRVIDGKKTLFVEEVQSDWHQKGKREGYQTDQPQFWVRNTRSGNGSPFFDTMAEADAYRNALPDSVRTQTVISQRPRTTGTVPDAPFKTTWPDLAMKRVIRQAAEGGYDKVAWTPGSVQAERYDLSKHVDGIDVRPRTDAVTGDKSYSGLVRLNNGKVMSVGYGNNGIIDNVGASNMEMKGKHLSDVFGKDIAEKMMSGKSVFDADLKIGGEGMKGFYDEILPATVNKIVKKAGGRVEQAQLGGTIPQFSMEGHGPWVVRDQNGTMLRDFNNRELAEAYLKQRQADVVKQTTPTVHSVTITPQLREMALKKGFPLFTAGGIVVGGAMGDLAKQDEYQ